MYEATALFEHVINWNSQSSIKNRNGYHYFYLYLALTLPI